MRLPRHELLARGADHSEVFGGQNRKQLQSRTQGHLEFRLHVFLSSQATELSWATGSALSEDDCVPAGTPEIRKTDISKLY